MKKTLFLLIFLMSFQLNAQIKIQGTVADDSEPLFGAVVLLKIPRLLALQINKVHLHLRLINQGSIY